MCIAILKPYSKRISKKIFRNCWENNSDGGGIAFIKDGKIHTRKSLVGWRSLWRIYQGIEEDEGTPMLLHFRIATHGSTCEKNTHPFLIRDGEAAVIHNGIIDVPTVGDETDTLAFCREYLEPMFDLIGKKKAYQEFLEYKTRGSKLVILRADGSYVILNESSGHWNNGVWYSNKTYEESLFKYSKEKFGRPYVWQGHNQWNWGDDDVYTRTYFDQKKEYEEREKAKSSSLETINAIRQRELEQAFGAMDSGMIDSIDLTKCMWCDVTLEEVPLAGKMPECGDCRELLKQKFS